MIDSVVDQTADQVLVRLTGVARTFGRGRAAVVAVHGLSCSVRAGQSIAIVGPSGSGKSTLLNLLAGIDEPSEGRVSWPAFGDSPRRLRPGTIGMVFQGPSLLFDLDVEENVALIPLLAGKDADSAKTSARAMVARLGLSDLLNKLPDELSGGQAQRIAVARALVGNPRLIIADEPTGQLDTDHGAEVIDLLVEQARREGAALVVSTHDEAVASKLVERWTMADGHLQPPVDVPC